MALTKDMDLQMRKQIAAHFRQRRKQLGISINAFAVQMDTDPATLRKFLQGERTSIGLDVFIKAYVNLKIDATTMLQVKPAAEFWVPDRRGDDEDEEKPSKRTRSNPSHASPPVQSGRR